MASMTFTVPDAIGGRVVDGFCRKHGYQAEIDGQPNPETPFAFMGRIVSEFIVDSVAYSEIQAAQEAAREQAESAARTAIHITVS